MTEKICYSDFGAADPTTEPFWQACAEGRLTVQHCKNCGTHQFYPRPFCLSCESTSLKWVDVTGAGTIYSIATMRMPVAPELPPPYLLAIVELDEGPRLLTNIVAESASIGERVGVTWRQREGGLPPLPVFKPV
ncbi:Zn-ribbon domain-containing OB-fold protein [Mesorhizobium yinganensis]|uniref:Zn-ribbon domain-containing OB-fold protein n=1 Tax=Mesorhizobium yinganensis TaxID=3157707 RepID=UPI0032B75B5F